MGGTHRYKQRIISDSSTPETAAQSSTKTCIQGRDPLLVLLRLQSCSCSIFQISFLERAAGSCSAPLILLCSPNPLQEGQSCRGPEKLQTFEGQYVAVAASGVVVVQRNEQCSFEKMVSEIGAAAFLKSTRRS